MKTSLLIGPEYRQVAIKTEKGVRQLRFIRSEKIERMDERAMKAEDDIEIMNLDEINIEKITGFAGTRFSDCINKDDRKPVDDPLHKLFTSGNGEMFEGSESFTWISEED